MHSTYLRPRKARVRANLPVERPITFYLRHRMLDSACTMYAIPWPKARPYGAYHPRTAHLRRTTCIPRYGHA